MADLTGFFSGQGFDPATAPPDVVPPGNYVVQVEKCEIKQTKAGDGHYVEVDMVILDECPSKGRHLWDRLNIHNKNPEAVKMAQRSLGALCVAAGIPDLKDTDMLLQVMVVACVKVKDGDNNIRTYKPAGQAQSAVAPIAPAAPVSAPMHHAQAGGAVAQAAPGTPAVSGYAHVQESPASVAAPVAPAVQAQPLLSGQYAQAPAVAPQAAPAATIASVPAATQAPWLKK